MSHSHDSVRPIREQFADTDLCVKCGLCLPHCPTYRLTQDESESPRGRLALIQGWAEGKLAATPALRAHLDNCLNCRSCEAVCPAKVPYGRLLDDFRANQPHASEGLKGRLARRILAKEAWRVNLAALARHYGRWPGQALLSRLAPAAWATLAQTTEPLALQAFYPAHSKETARIALFVGCTGNWLDAATLRAAIGTLTRLGVAVTVPAEQGCCGALHWHAGDRVTAEPLLQNYRTRFSEADTIVAFASGCGTFLAEHGGLKQQPIDLSSFLLNLPWPEDAKLQPLPAKACLHMPCTLGKRLGDPSAPARLLRKIPALQLTVLSNQPGCCGAAGTYALDHANVAERLRDELIEQIENSQATYLLTSNVGCACHLRAGLATHGLDSPEVLHPVTLLARSLGVSEHGICGQACG